MENSVTSDAAGVQKNIAKMYEEHAKSIGKKTDSLTQAEKAQAVYNGIMEETEAVAGSAAEIAEQYEGAEAQKNAELLKTKQLLGESLIPTYSELSKVQKDILLGINNMIKGNKSATSGVVTFTVALTAGAVAIGLGTKAINMYKAAAASADMTTKAFTASLLANPLFIGTLAISAGVAALNAFNTAMQESIDKMEQNAETTKSVVELLQNFQNNGMSYTEEESIQVVNIRNETNEIIVEYENRKNKIKEIQNQINEINERDGSGKNPKLEVLENQLYAATENLKKFEKENLAGADSADQLNKRVEILNRTLELNKAKQDYLTLTNQKASREALINVAQTKADIQGKQELLNILKEGKTETEEYADAKNKLVKAYPELAKVNENTIASTQAMIDAENLAAENEWKNAQNIIKISLEQTQAMASNSDLIIKICAATGKSVEEVTASLQNQIMVLQNLQSLTPTDFKGSIDTTTYKPKVSKTSKTYQNKALDNYKKQIEYKKSLDQISLQQEINMYQTALRKYAKTTDEKRELTTKVYELQKELQQKELDDYISNIEYKKSLDKITTQEEINMYEHAYNTLAKTTEQKRELEVTLYELRKELAEANSEKLKEESDKERELLNQKTREYQKYIKDQENLRGAEYDIKDRKADLDKIIKMHQEYLNQILKDERYSLDERKEIYEEELDIIREYEQQKRDLRVSAINNTVSQLKIAITKQLEEMQEVDKEAIEENIKLVEEWKETRINAINEEYEARIEAIQKELDLLDKAEQDKSRQEEDTEYNKKKKRLEGLIEFEHDAVTKANYQKELDKLVSDYQKTLDKRVLQDKKDTLKEQQELLKEEQDNKVQAIEDEADKQKEVYDKQLDDLDEYYSKQIDMAQETAEKMLLNVEKNQEQIINLLNKYGNKYEITGQSLGEKLAQGINEGLTGKIEGIIQKIQDKIDGIIEAQISKIVGSSYQYTTGTNKPQVSSKTVNVTQNNYIQQNPEMPSEAHRKLKNVSENLAEQLAGI